MAAHEEGCRMSSEDDEKSDEKSVEDSNEGPKGLVLQKAADYQVHEVYEVDADGRHDHSFCGIMFDLEVHDTIPCDIEITGISVKGTLGKMTVWFAEGGMRGVECRPAAWTRVFSRKVAGNFDEFTELKLDTPFTLGHGKSVGIYVHSADHTDSSVVYDDQRNSITRRDKFITVKAGCAHVSPVPFQGVDVFERWTYRPYREFVGKISYGVRYRLWRPQRPIAQSFPKSFKLGAKLILLCASRDESPLSCLPHNVVLYLINLLAWDWFGGLAEEEAVSMVTSENHDEEKPRTWGIYWEMENEHGFSYREDILAHARSCLNQIDGNPEDFDE